MSDKRQLGMYEKFRVERTDGRDVPGEKHEGCSYFVLDLDHDPHAIPAILAYANSCRADGYDQLADELEAIFPSEVDQAEAENERLRKLASLLTVRQVIEAGDDYINAAGLNPYCMAEGLATGDENISP